MALLSIIDFLIFIIGAVGLLYQLVCIVMGLFTPVKKFPQAPCDKRYAVLISARNEQAVIGNLIDCIWGQTYPKELIDIWIVADNCTDDTAQLARDKGCHVVERFDQTQIGKGFALTFLLNTMIDRGVAKQYDAFFVFDADNLLDKDYFMQMNNGFHAGYPILTSYRNSVNFDENWVSSGSALWFVRESRFLNNSRMAIGTNCHVGGTGFMFSREIMERNEGWKFHLLTEDLEFTLDSILHGDKIGYCGTAILYDEQPVTFRQSWRQRLRWSRGFLQVFRYYGPAMIRRAITERDFSCIDLALLICPFTLLTGIRLVLGALFALLGFVSWQSQFASLYSGVSSGLLAVLALMGLAALTCIAERDRIDATNLELVAYCLSFPIYLISYIPISFQAMFSQPGWKPIEHKGKAKVPHNATCM